jgi:hypothetical protein
MQLGFQRTQLGNNAASQSCHTGAVDMTQFYNEALTGPDLNVGDQTPKLSLIIRCQ